MSSQTQSRGEDRRTAEFGLLSDRSWRQEPGAFQRSRIVSAMVDVVCERGLQGTSVAPVVARSGVSRRTFYELFENRDDCFLAAFEHALTQLQDRVLPACEAESRFLDAVRAGLLALLSFFDEEPDLAWLCIVEALAGSEATLTRRKEVLRSLAVMLGAGFAVSRDGVAPLTSEGVLGGVFAVLHARLLEADSPPLVELCSELMAMIVLPYLGPTAARRELARRAPKPRRPPASDHGPARFGTRLTYRMLRSLSAIAEQPGASNREVAESAGITDPGQVSKLLKRLRDLDLAVNSGPGQAAGLANAWTITPKGQALLRSVGLDESARSLRVR